MRDNLAPNIDLALIADMDKRRVLTLAKCAKAISHDDQLYAECLMALGIEDEDYPDTWLDELLLRPEAASLADRIADWIMRQSNAGAEAALRMNDGSTARSAYGGGSYALKRVAEELTASIADKDQPHD